MGARRPPYNPYCVCSGGISDPRSAGLLVFRLDVSLLVVGQLLLDLGIAHQIVSVALDLLGLDYLLEALADTVISWRLQIARLNELDYVPTVLRLNGLVG